MRGKAHLSISARPLADRRLLSGLNDVDETLLWPFDFDVMAMAAGFAIPAG